MRPSAATATVLLTTALGCLCGLGGGDKDKDGFTEKDGDCNDAAADVFPGATEVCDGADQDCDGNIDEAPAGTVFYADEDDDGFGDEGSETRACEAPTGFVTEGGDCDDGDEAVNPDATDDTLDGVDDDCNGEVDDAVPFTLDDLSPTQGTIDGGTDVTLFGGPFDDSVEVTFDGKAASVRSVDTDSLVVRTPAHAAGTVDVEVTRGDASDTLRDAFTYVEAATGTVVYGQVTYVDYVGDYESETDIVIGYALVTDPWDLTAREAFWSALGLDACDNNAAGLPLADVPGAAALPKSIGLKGTAGTITLSPDVDYPFWYLNSGSDASTWVEGGAYAFVTAKNGSWAATNVSNALRFPDALTLTTPTLTTATKVARGMALAWTGGTPGQYVAINVTQYDTSFNPVEQVVCIAKDDGSFSIPSSAWSSWAAGRYVWVEVRREGITESALPDGSAMLFGGGYAVAGIASTK